jgi:LmbE family N-acetylglucosaminyl deacetylase
MKLYNESAEFFVPDGKSVEEALKRTTHMGISAHQDDIEIMAYDGILECFGKDDKWFFGVVVTNGAGSPRADLYEKYTDEDMIIVRKKEQKKAAFIGEYSGVALLDYTSSQVKDANNEKPVDELEALLRKAAPKVVYTQNLADKHDTHVGVTLKVIKAIRRLPKELRPEKLYGCEVWRNLDWMLDEDKVSFNVSGHPNIASALVEIHDSQVCGGKRYDLATMGRRKAHATYAASHGTDDAEYLIFGMDLTPLIQDDSLDVLEYVQSYINRFANDVASKIKKMS